MRCSLTVRILAMVLSVAVVAAGGLWAQHEIGRRTQQEVRSIAAAEYAACDTARVMQVAFKTQVQEWKNILLRGYNAERLAKHRAAMTAAAAEVDRLATGLLAVAHEQERVLLEDFRASHADLDKRYGRALSQVEMAEEWDFKGGDIAVTGLDRKPNEACDGIVAAFTVRAHDRLEAAYVVAARDERRVLVAVGASLALALMFAVWYSRRLTRPVREALAAVERMARGDLRTNVVARSRDEIGDLARALDGALNDMRLALGAEQVDWTGYGTARQSMRMLQARLGTSAEALARLGHDLAGSSTRNADRARSLTGVAELLSQGASTAAAGTQEMGASISEIAGTATEATRIAGEAVALAAQARTTMATLGESSRAIGDVVTLIGGIAHQVNLLALNATIEAARAGEAGRGFAVVAREVKQLATRTTEAAQGIGGSLGGITSGLAEALQSIERIDTSVRRIHEAQSSIAAAVEEQTATTGEIAKSVQDSASASTQIAGEVMRLASETGKVSESVRELEHAAAELSHLAEELRAQAA